MVLKFKKELFHMIQDNYLKDSITNYYNSDNEKPPVENKFDKIRSKRKRNGKEIDEDLITQFKDIEKLKDSEKLLFEEFKEFKKKIKVNKSNLSDLEPTLIGSPKLYKNLKNYICKFLDINSLKMLRLTGKQEKNLVDDVISSLVIYEKKIPQDFGFRGDKLFHHFEKFIKNCNNKDAIIKQSKINRLNKGESLEECGFTSYENLYLTLGSEDAKKITTIADLKSQYTLHQQLRNNQTQFNVKEFALKYPNIERVDLIVHPQFNPFPENIIQEMVEIFPDLVHLRVDQFTINDVCVQDLKKLKKFKDLEIIGDSLSQMDFLNDLNLKRLTIDGFSKDISEHLKLSNLEEINLKNLNQLSHLLFLKNCLNLKTVRIENCQNIEDFSILEKISNLKELHLSDCEDVNLDFLGKIKGLEKLTLINCGNYIENIEFPWSVNMKFLNTLNHLKVLEIIGKKDEGQDINFTGVDSSNTLQILKIQNGALSKDDRYDIDIGEIFPNLKSLDLIYCKHLDSCNFEKLTGLNKLILDESDVRKLNFIKKLKQLKSISVAECESLQNKQSKILDHIKYLTWIDGHELILKK